MTTNSYRPEIDGIRALAVSIVLLYHGFPDAVPGGFIGVDVFFVISGYLITKIIYVKAISGKFSYRDFYAARIRRIFPALGIVLISTFFAGYYYLLPADFASLGRHIAASTLFLANIVFWSEAGYFDTAAISKPLLHLWSLGVEEQFYLIWPVVISVGVWWRRYTSLLIAAVLVFSFAYSVYLTNTDPTAAFYSPLSRAWELCIGALLVFVEGRYRDARLPFRQGIETVLGGIAIAAIGWATFTYNKETAFPGIAALVPTMATAALVLFSSSPRALPRILLSWRPVVAIGLISYPLYLWHWPLISFSNVIYGEPPSHPQMAMLLLLSVALAGGTYLLVERPIRTTPLARRLAIPGSLGLVLSCTLLGGLSLWQSGLAERFPPDVQSVLAYGNYPYETDGRYPTCWVPTEQPFDQTASECFQTSLVANQSTLIMWGDSYTARLYAGMRLALPDAAITQLTRNSCPPLLGMPEACGEQNLKVVRYLAEQADGSTLLLFGSWENYGAFTADSEMAARLDNTLAELAALNLKVVLVGPAPFWEEVLPALVYRSWASGTLDRKLPDRLADRISSRPFDAQTTIKAIAEKRGVKYISLLDYLCSEDGCLTHVPTSPSDLISWDHGHLTTNGAEFISRYLLSQMQNAQTALAD